MLQPRRKVPDVIRRGLRLSIGLAICNSLGFLLADKFGDLAPRLGPNIVQGAKWASITCIVVSAPVTGRVAQVSLERTLGTITGGSLGFFVYVVDHNIDSWGDQMYLVALTSAVGFMSVLVGRWLHLDYSAKLYVMTFVLVVMAAEHSTDAAIVAATRISGICFGVICSVALSVVIFPKSANCEAVDAMCHALQDLSAFHSLAWTGGRTEAIPGDAPELFQKRKTRKTDMYTQIGTTLEYQGTMTDKDRRELACEKVLMDVYSKLGACEGFLKDAASEVYFTTIHGRWCFLPGIMWFTLGKWRLPKDEMLEVGTSIRKVARVLWSMHVLFNEGFDVDSMRHLLNLYPPDLLLQLQTTSHGAIQDMLEAFPNGTAVATDHLYRFVQGHQVLFKTADWHRRRMGRWVRAGATQSDTGSRMPSDSDGSGDGNGGNGGGMPHNGPSAAYAAPPRALTGLQSAPSTVLAAGIDESYLALRGLSPRAVGHDEGTAASAPRPSQGSWAEKLQERSHHGGARLAEDARALTFPETTAGHFAEVRWISFQFVLAQLAEELSDMSDAMERLLTQFPQTALPAVSCNTGISVGPLPLSPSAAAAAFAAEEGRAPLLSPHEITSSHR